MSNAALLTSLSSGFEIQERLCPLAEATPIGVCKNLQLPSFGGRWDLQTKGAKKALERFCTGCTGPKHTAVEGPDLGAQTAAPPSSQLCRAFSRDFTLDLGWVWGADLGVWWERNGDGRWQEDGGVTLRSCLSPQPRELAQTCPESNDDTQAADRHGRAYYPQSP